MNLSAFNKSVLAPLKKWGHLGHGKSESGATLIGHVPHIAPKAYMHVIYAPVGETSIQKLEQRLGRAIPNQLRDFYNYANGLDVFFGALIIEGFVPYEKKIEMHPHHYPSNLVISNVSARIKGLNHEDVLVGINRFDGSLVYIKSDDGAVICFDAYGDGAAIQEWPDFDTWLFSEIERLGKLYDGKGRLQDIPKGTSSRLMPLTANETLK